MGKLRGNPNAYKEPARQLNPVVYALRKRRIASGVTQGDMAEIAGYSHRTIEAWERGNNPPTLLALQAWAQVLGLRVALLDKDGNEVT